MKYDHYLVEISEPMSSNETLGIRIMLSNGRSVYFFGDNAQNVIDILNGDLKAIGDSVLREELRKRDEKIKELESLVKDRNNVVAHLRTDFEIQRKSIVEKRDAIDSLKKKNAELIKENQQLKDLYDGRSEFISEQGDEKRKLMEENQKLRKKNDDLADRNFDLAEELEKKEAILKDFFEISNHNFETTALRKKIKDLEDQLDAERAASRKFQDRIEDQKTTIDILEKSYAEAMGEKDKEITKLKNSNEVLTNELHNELSERNCIATYELTISRLERRNKELEGIILKREERIGELMQHKEWLERNSFHGIAVCNGSIGEKVKYAVDNMKLEYENQKLRNKNNLLQAQNTRFRDACINAGLRLKELHTYLTSLDEE